MRKMYRSYSDGMVQDCGISVAGAWRILVSQSMDGEKQGRRSLPAISVG